MINIEKTILATILENDFLMMDSRIHEFKIEHKYFTGDNIFIVKAINRLKELDEPVCTDTLWDKLVNNATWEQRQKNAIKYEELLIDIIARNIFSYKIMIKYYDFIKNKHNNTNKVLEMKYI